MPILRTLEEAQALLERCFAAYDEAARAQFVKDGSQDCGSCGGAMLAYSVSSLFGQALDASGQCTKDGDLRFLCRSYPEGVQTQHAEVDIQATLAFRAMASEHGAEARKYWTYVD